MKAKPVYRIERSELDSILESIVTHGYTSVGPTVREGAIVYDEITRIDDLPEGWTEEQEAGRYRLKRRDDSALFGFNNGPHSWKQYLFPPKEKLWQAVKTIDGFAVEEHKDTEKPYAFIGVRSCDLHAIHVQDRVFFSDQNPDPLYARRRQDALIVVVNCSQAASTCFCTSMNTGPRAEQGFDLALTEVINSSDHYFIVEVGSDKGLSILEDTPHVVASDDQVIAAQAVSQRAAEQMGRKIDISDIKDLLYRNYDNQRWDELESRCFACGNCTMACPTCFCSKVEDVTDLTGDHAERWREWDSCFTMDFSYLHGGSVRQSTRSRYRQWLMHKLATWIDQFDTSGCVGCGRCITWCPVGIDLTEEVRAIRESETKCEDKEEADHG